MNTRRGRELATACVATTCPLVVARADPGLSSLAALRPILLTFLVLIVALGAWFVFSLFLVFAAPATLTQRKLGVYKVATFTLIGAFFVVAILGSTFLSPVALLGAIFIAAVIGAIAAATLARSRRRLAAGMPETS